MKEKRRVATRNKLMLLAQKYLVERGLSPKGTVYILASKMGLEPGSSKHEAWLFLANTFGIDPKTIYGIEKFEEKTSRKKLKQVSKKQDYAAFHAFYLTKEWQKLRYQALIKYGRKCHCCGAIDKLHVDHIKPRFKYPELELSLDNLQILCEDCNMGKGGWDETDWRPQPEQAEIDPPTSKPH